MCIKNSSCGKADSLLVLPFVEFSEMSKHGRKDSAV
jgi:hypothetical protein